MSSTDYESMTKTDLQAEADKRNLEYTSADTKADLISLLEADDAGETVEVDAQSGEEIPAAESLPDPQPGPFAGEVGPVVLAGYWVRLADDGIVPAEMVGHLAQIVDSPWKPAPIGAPDQPIGGYIFDDTGTFIVRTRDQYNALVQDLTLDSFSEIDENRVGVHV
jgi:hypothetical protein